MDDKKNPRSERQVVLHPGQVWAPYKKDNLSPFDSEMEKNTTEDKCNFHVYRKVTLFTSTVEECKKCGKLRDE